MAQPLPGPVGAPPGRSAHRGRPRQTPTKGYVMNSDATAADRIIGTLRTEDGHGVVRMQDRFDTEIDDLWSALTDPARLARWLGEFDGDLRQGGEFTARFYASEWQGNGRVDACDPPRHLAITTMQAGPAKQHTIEATLIPDGDGTTLILEERGMPLNLLAAYGA